MVTVIAPRGSKDSQNIATRQYPGKGDHEHRDGSTIQESGHEDCDGRTGLRRWTRNKSRTISCGTR